MKLNIDKKIYQQYPDLKVGIVIVRGFNNSKRSSMVESLLRGACAQKAKEFVEKDLHKEPMISVWDQAYGNFGGNPKKFPPLHAGLIKRIKPGKELEHMTLLSDLCNYYALKYMLPVRGIDMDWLYEDVQLTYTQGKEAFRPKGSIDVEEALEGEVCYEDKGGIIFRYWNNRECERTKLSNRTVNSLIIVEDLSKMHFDQFGKIIEEIGNAVAKYVGGRVETHTFTEENSSADLGVEGRQSANDKKITKQEKVHFETEVEKAKKKRLKTSKKSTKKTAKKKAEKPMQMSLIPPKDGILLDSGDFLKEKIKKVVEHAVIKTFPNIIHFNAHMEYPASQEHGDYSCNLAFQLAKELGLAPKDIAEAILKNMPEDALVDKVEIAGAGFLNFFLKKEVLKDEIDKILKEGSKYGSLTVGKGKTIVLDYSAPNIAKPLGVHHLLSTIIGQTICNIYKKLGAKTVSINHIGDWGTQFGKLIYAYKQWGDRETIEKDPINELLKLYVKFHEESEKNPKLEDEGRSEFMKFEKGDEENKKLWRWFVDESIKAIEKTYEKLGGIKFDFVHGESFYEDKMDAILKEGKEKGIFVKGDEGAFVVQYDEQDIAPFVVQKKDGATLYSTRDFATLKYRIDTWHPAKLLYVVDVAQSMHFKQLFKAAERFPWYHGEAEHIIFGRMHMKDGSMSTRKGNVVLLEDLLEEAIKRAEKIVEEKNPNHPNKAEVSKKIGVGAVKYNILCQNRISDITFDWDKMLALDGNSAPYLQYVYARAKSILRKKDEDSGNSYPDPEDAEEKIMNLIRLMPKFSEQIAMAAKENKPNVITNYLYDFAQTFNSFYNGVPVLRAANEEDKKFRLKIVGAAAQIIKNGLELLGIEVSEEM